MLIHGGTTSISLFHFTAAELQYAALGKEQLVFDKAKNNVDDEEKFGFGDPSVVQRTLQRASNYIDPANLTVQNEIGQGQFGMVCKVSGQNWTERLVSLLSLLLFVLSLSFISFDSFLHLFRCFYFL